jgi:MSHA pilin protein MshC
MPRTAPYRAQAASSAGYTLVELVVVMAIAGVLAAYIAPRFWTQQTFSDRGYADELAAALRFAQKAAVITGCPARLTLAASSYAAAQQAPAGNTCNTADATWSTALVGADGAVIQNSAPSGSSASPTGVFQFDTQGRLASGPATTISVGTRTITIVAATGLIQVL